MKTRLIIFLLAFVTVSTKVASQPFYDSKCMVIGLTSNNDIYGQYGLGGKTFMNEVASKNIEYTTKGDKIVPEDTRQDLLKKNFGKQVLDVLFERNKGQLSEDLLRERAWANVQLTDIERAKFSVYSPEIILKEDILPILENNYILIVKPIYKQTKDGKKLKKQAWAVYHVDITEQTLNEVYAAWNNLQQYDRINVGISYLASGVCKPDNLMKEIAKKAPPLAVRGQVISSDPYLCKLGIENTKSLAAERFVIYTQKETGKGKLKSVPVSKARMKGMQDDNFGLVTVAGLRKGDPSKGDIAVFSPVSPLSLTALVQHQSFANGLRLEFGRKVDVGVLNYIMDFDFRATRLSDHKTSVYAVGEEGQYLVRSPQYLSAGLGCSYNFRIIKGLTVGPYFRVMGDVWLSEYMQGFARKDEKTGKVKEGWWSISLRFPLGVKATMNLCYPLHLVGGVEWAPLLLRDGDVKNILKSRGWSSGEIGLFVGLNYAF